MADNKKASESSNLRPNLNDLNEGGPRECLTSGRAVVAPEWSQVYLQYLRLIATGWSHVEWQNNVQIAPNGEPGNHPTRESSGIPGNGRKEDSESADRRPGPASQAEGVSREFLTSGPRANGQPDG